MRREPPSFVRSGHSALLALALLALPLLSACFEPTTVACPAGLYCPAGQKCAARQEICLKTDCGDGIIQLGEVCDDGNIVDGDGCSRTCASNEICGNKVVDIAAGEKCDDGNTKSGDDCSSDCRSNEVCGNSIVDTAVGEVCDDGNTRSGDGCSADCLSAEVCGNGITDTAKGELCDDGNNESGDGCSGNCKSNETCGNGITDTAKGEVCDDGNNVSGDDCSSDCRSDETCGNNIIDDIRGEVCDDGNNVSGDNCSADCRSSEGCGNGVRDPEEDCDAKGESATCNANCTLRRCGDSILNRTAGEQCDTGGESETCNNNCTAVACGDGIVNTTAHEQCDVVGGGDTTSCDSDCTIAYCGDNRVNPVRGELCDSGARNTATCNADCTPAACGDRFLNTAANEVCDEGPSSPNCDPDCTPAFCGDNLINVVRGERCDDGNSRSDDDCLDTCQPNVCGDSILNVSGPSHPEACDDGNTTTESSCPYGTAECDRCSADCKTPLLNLRGNVCGDGSKDPNPANEACDDGNTTTEANCPYGTASCNKCSSDCKTPLPNLRGNICGDGSKDLDPANEVCDDGNTIKETACRYGTLDCNQCDSDCKTILVLRGNVCGDGVKDTNPANEQCDDGNTSACGTCSSDCKTRTLAYATGTITAVASSGIQDGQTFTISDGINPPIIFEFDRNNSHNNSRVPVPVSNSTPADQIALGIVTAINGVTDPFEIKATSSGNIVTLTHNMQGTIGNQVMTETVQDGNFKVNGMKGGGGYDCTEGTKCTTTADCERGLTCLDNTCSTPPAPTP
ncbi:DUF4215 domain-containing protein [Archangium lipolyticum]|uniref:DUF4215 domain-containing protein n=1 Tax=Archangium lipolyticum TaxID=2970465 RepID=UPI002149B0E9|nr:DUF4215 domain-containing protein [Archangium lipolyticum]